MQTVVAALYCFADLPDYEALQAPLLELCTLHEVRGSLLLAHEGINGTVSGSRNGIDALLNFLRADERFLGMEYKESFTEETPPFRKTKIRLKKEIVTLGRPDLNPLTHPVGTYTDPKDWNALISDPDVRVIDTRNDFECEIGTFEGAENPHTDSFTDFPEFVATHMDPTQDKKVAMFCTGGIRCEKATAFMLEQGFEEVHHLRGGILRYLEEVDPEESLWQGECFVFDDRVTLNHRLEPGDTEVCRGCWEPLQTGMQEHLDYEEGVCCPRCRPKKTPERLSAAREREKQRLLTLKRESATS